MLPCDTEVVQGPSVQEWVLGTLRERGSQTLDQLGDALPSANWAQLLLAIDRLSRQGDIAMRIHAHGDYLVALKSSVPTSDQGKGLNMQRAVKSTG
jgi:hypothetical protein